MNSQKMILNLKEIDKYIYWGYQDIAHDKLLNLIERLNDQTRNKNRVKKSAN
jgi:hypothetical protein